MSSDTYEVKQSAIDKESLAFFEKIPQYYHELV